MSKYIIEQEFSKKDLDKLLEYYLQEKVKDTTLNKEKVHEEFSHLCRKASKNDVEEFTKTFQASLDMNYEEGFFPTIAVNHDNKSVLEFFYERYQDIYNKYYDNLINAAVFNQSTHCQEFLNSHNVEVSGIDEQHDEY